MNYLPLFRRQPWLKVTVLSLLLALSVSAYAANAPTDIDLSATTIAENNAANATVGTLSTTDVDAGDTFTYTLVSGTGSTDNSSFTISGDALKLTPSANFETQSSYAVRLRTTDAGGLFYEEALTISITDVAESPSSISASGGSGTAITSPQLTARMVFANNGSTANLAEADALLAGSNVLRQFTGPITKVDFADSGTNGRFNGVLPFPGEASIVSINHFVLQVTGSIYVPTSGQWTFGVRSDDGSRIRIDGVTQLVDNSQHGEEDRYVTVTLTAGTHSLDFLFFEHGGGAQVELFSAPGAHSSFNGDFTLITSNSISIVEEVPANSLVTTLTAQDEDAGSTATFALVTGTGDDDNASFTLSSGGELTINNSPDYEVKNLYSIRVRATDGTGLTVDEVLQISISNVNEAPTDIALSASSIAENNAANETVGILSTTDVDAGDTFTYTLVSGTGDTDNASFTISGTSLKLTPSADYETKSTYAVRVRTTDAGGLFYEEAFTISITKVNEWPARETERSWGSITSSADGSKLAAVVNGGQIYTSTDSGVTWTEQNSGSRPWGSITSSADGSKLAAADRYGPNYQGGQIYTSTDSGVTWTADGGNRRWSSITSSADGSKLAAVEEGGQIYTSPMPISLTVTVTSVSPTSGSTAGGTAVTITGTDLTGATHVTIGGVVATNLTVVNATTIICTTPEGTPGTASVLVITPGGTNAENSLYSYSGSRPGESWTAQDSGSRSWCSITSSADGSKLAAVDQYGPNYNGGQIYTSTDSGVTWTVAAAKSVLIRPSSSGRCE